MTSKLVVNTIEADTGISSVSFASSITLSSTSVFHFSDSGVNIGADTNISRLGNGILGFKINGAEKFRIDSSGHIKAVGVCTATHFYGDGSNLTGITQTTINNNTDNYVITGTGTANTLRGESGVIITSDSELIVGMSAGSGATPDARLQVRGENHTRSKIQVLATHNDDNPATLQISKSRSGGNTILGDNDDIGQLNFAGNDGNGYHTVGRIMVSSSGEGNGDDDLPSVMRFFTTANGGVSLTEKMRLNSSGQLLLGSTSSANSGYKFESYSSGAYNIMAKSTNGNGGYHNFTGQASNGTITSYITHNGRGYFEDGVQFDSSGEVLDSYEEGSFTLTAAPSSSGTLSLNSSYNTGVYTRVGNLVHIQAYLSFSGNNNATGYLQLSPLPFTVDSNQAQASGHVRSLQIVYLNGQYAYLPDGAGYYNAQLYCNEGQTWIRIYDLNGSGRRIDTIARHFSGGADVFLNFSYLAV